MLSFRTILCFQAIMGIGPLSFLDIIGFSDVGFPSLGNPSTGKK